MIEDYFALVDALSEIQARSKADKNDYHTIKLTTWECEALERLLEKMVGPEAQGAPV